MAKEDTSVTVTATDLASLIKAVESNAPLKKVPFSKHNPRSSFAEGKTKKERATLERNVMLNGYRLNPKTMFDSEILLSNIVQPGRFLDGLVIVQVVESSSPDDPDTVYVNFQNKTVDQRFTMARETGNSLTTLLRRCCEDAGIDTKHIPTPAPPKRKRVVN